MNSYYYNIISNDVQAVTEALRTHLIPDYVDAVTHEGSVISFVKNNNVIAEMNLAADGTYGYSLSGNNGTVRRELGSTNRSCYSIHTTDHAVLMTTTDDYGTKYVTIFTKNQNDDTVFISADSNDYFAFCETDTATPVTITTVSANDKYVTELVPYTTNTSTNGLSYTPYAFWIPITSSYPSTGSITYTFVRTVDQNNNEYFYNGWCAIS